MPSGVALLVNITLNSFRLLSMDQKEETIQFQNEFLMLLDPISYAGNAEWRLEKILAQQVETLFVGDLKQAWTGNFSQIRYSIYLQREPVYYIMVIQIPTFIIGTITIFGLFSSYSQRMERWHILDIGQNMLLAISYMLNLISDMMPKTAQLPLLGNYIIAEIFVCAIGMLISIVILEFHARADQRNWRPPDWLCKIVLFSCRRMKVKALAQPDPVRKRTIPITKIDDEVADMLKLDLVKGQLKKSLHLVRDFMERDDAEHEWKLLWVMIFDRIDFFFLFLFQIVNIVVSALFMR
ncbi:unnamed protein product, partial [Mesorhabditis belari]|uniref:Neurotransmitter-gated ion-channel transmembrane domain-containing protein n=1 Tax=Mesorhabditis belari TaxID=2138241 RepID=A0AAF3ECE9_9BILA